MLCERHRAELCLPVVGLWAGLTKRCLWVLSELVRKDASRLSSLSFSQVLGIGWSHLLLWVAKLLASFCLLPRLPRRAVIYLGKGDSPWRLVVAVPVVDEPLQHTGSPWDLCYQRQRRALCQERTTACLFLQD